jgi:uncharacterized protein YebE (UPF0316 family)
MEELLAGPFGPILIFLLRIGDVSLATLRLISAVRGRKLLAASVGFVEVSIWIVVVATVVRNLHSPLLVLAYAGGFATGTWVGMTIEEKLALGLAEVQVVSRAAGVEIAEALREAGFGVTEMLGQGREGRVEIIYTVVRRSSLKKVTSVVDLWDPQAFVRVEEPRSIQRGWLLSRRRK